MLPTKQLIIESLQNNSLNCEDPDQFSNKDLAVKYDHAFDFDGNLLCLVFESCDQLNYITEALVFLFMVRDQRLQKVAIVYFLRENDLMDMLLESQGVYTLNFEINKDISLRTFLQDKFFKEIVHTAVQIIGETDYS